MAEKKECGQICEKTFAYQQPDVLKRFEDGFILRQMTYEDTRFVNINIRTVLRRNCTGHIT